MADILLSEPSLDEKSSKHYEKLSDIIGREIESFLKSSTVAETVIKCDEPSAEDENDILQLIQLSKQMQSEYKSFLNEGYGFGSPSKETQLKEVCCGQPSANPNPQTNVPPLILGVDYHMDDYYIDLVDKHFTQANRQIENDIVKKTKHVKTVKDIANQDDFSSKKNVCNSTRSQPTISPKKMKPSKIYPKTHSCVELSVQKYRKPTGLSQSARAAYSARYYDFEETHPNIKLSSTNTLFPCRSVKTDLHTLYGSLESLKTSSLSSIAVEDTDCRESIITHSVVTNDQAFGNMEDDEIHNNPQSESKCDKQKISVVDSWHNVLSSNSLLLPISNEIATNVPEAASTVPDMEPGVNNDTTINDQVLTTCAIQVLPPLVIKGVCRIQHLSHISIDGPNFTNNPDQFPNTPNHKYLNIVFDKIDQPLPASGQQPLVADPLVLDSPKETLRKPKKSHTDTTTPEPSEKVKLQASATVLSTFDGSSTGTTNYMMTDDDEDNVTIVLPSQSSVNPIDSESTCNLESIITDDEKIENHRLKQFSNISKTKTRQKSLNACNSMQDKPFDNFSEGIMKIIDDIFETGASNPTESVYAYAQTDLSVFKDHIEPYYEQHCLASNPLIKPIDKSHSAVQTNQTFLDKCVGMSDKTSTQSGYKAASEEKPSNKSHTTTTDIEKRYIKSISTQAERAFVDVDEEDEHVNEDLIRATNSLFQSIQNRKAKLYNNLILPFASLERSCDTPLNTSNKASVKVSSVVELTASNKSCHHRKQLRTMGNVLPCNDTYSQILTNNLSAHSQSRLQEPPSVRLQQIRRMQQQQQLIQNNPDVLRTIDSIQREVQSSRTGITTQTDPNHIYRSNYNQSVIQDATKKCLEQITKLNQQQREVPGFAPESFWQPGKLDFPIWPSTYLDDSVQQEAEVFLKSVDAELKMDPVKKNNKYDEYSVTQSECSHDFSTTMDSFNFKSFYGTNSVYKEIRSNLGYTNSESDANVDISGTTPMLLSNSTLQTVSSRHQGIYSQEEVSQDKSVSSGERNSKQDCNNSSILKSTSSSIARQIETIQKRIQPDVLVSNTNTTTSNSDPV